jgi:hypothetical protein
MREVERKIEVEGVLLARVECKIALGDSPLLRILRRPGLALVVALVRHVVVARWFALDIRRLSVY